jgi:hypothetical protein
MVSRSASGVDGVNGCSFALVDEVITLRLLDTNIDVLMNQMNELIRVLADLQQRVEQLETAADPERGRLSDTGRSTASAPP